jgi:NAD(P)-dependent dehydrogenase (short-subunit alcohol dehydrogenase family)
MAKSLAKDTRSRYYKKHKLSTSTLPFLNQLFSLQGRSAIITGGGTGIGAAIAMGLARAGASVCLTGRREKVLLEVSQTIQKQLNQDGLVENKVGFYPCDITDFEQIPCLVQEAAFLTGLAPTILINNAGVNVRQPANDLTSEHWHTSMHLMLTAPFMLMRSMSEGMKQEEYGRVISMASLQSFQAFPDSLPYAASKSGILGLTRALSEAYSAPRGYPNVTVNAISPGYVRTDLTKAVFDDEIRAQKLAEATLLGRNSEAADLVGACIFLASPASAYVTGQCLPVDGGFTALGMR